MKWIVFLSMLFLWQPAQECFEENYTELEEMLIRNNTQWFDMSVEMRLNVIEISTKYYWK